MIASAGAEVFGEWLRRQGHRVTRTQSSYWYDQGPRVYQAFPYHWIITPSDQELSDFLRSARAMALRYSTPLDAPEGRVSYHAILDDKAYGLESLGKWARKNVRRGLKHCRVEPIAWERLADEGYTLQADTLDRQGREVEMTPALWRRRCTAAADLPGFEAWGALAGGRLAASVITYQMDDWAYMLYQQCRREDLPLHVNNALSFEVTCGLLARPAVKAILYGLHSLDAPPSVDAFKFRMRYVARPVRQRVALHPWAAPLLGSSVGYATVERLRRLRPQRAAFAKAEGMLRFYREGRQPLERQAWPDCLLAQGDVDAPEGGEAE
jgi:hypothetical protein